MLYLGFDLRGKSKKFSWEVVRMFVKTLSVILALFTITGLAVSVKADVTGSFDLDIALNPEGTQTEAVKFEIDLQSNLQVNITLSGLTVGADLGFGVTGVEFAVLSLNTNLGALNVSDEFVFASPFACDIFPAGVSDFGGIVGQCAGNAVTPIGDADGDGVIDNAVGFVKKRIGLELNIAGITINNLAIFEDVDFPDIQGINPGTGLNDHEHDHFGTGTPYFLNGVNSVVDDQTPTFGFGDVITLTGQTVSGITLSGSTFLCADQRNYIKKRSWNYEVNEACTAQFGQPGGTVLEDGAKTPLLFEKETLSISGVEIGGVSLSIDTTFVPLQPVISEITASMALLDLADVTVSLLSDNITALSIGSIVINVSSGNFALSLLDFGGDLDIDIYIATLSTVLNANQNPADFSVTAIGINGVGLVRLDFNLGISRGPFNFSSRSSFTGGNADLNWSSTTFNVDMDLDTGLSFGANFNYTPLGMGTTSISLGVTF
jgi:hypothetical protein